MSTRGILTTVIGATFSTAVMCLLSIVCGSALAALPLQDGRAWEMVSPLEKNGGEINGIDGVAPNNGLPEGGIVQASIDGSSITYLSLLAFPDSKGNQPQGAPIASQYLSTRDTNGWSTEDLTTAVNSKTYPPAGSGAPYKAFSFDLSKGLMLNGTPPVENPTPPLVTGALLPPQGYQNYYLRNNADGKFEGLLTVAPIEDPRVFFLELLNITPDLNHIVIGTPAALTPGATQQERGNLYEWTDGQFQPINVLPEPGHPGETASGTALLGMGFNESRTISNDGTRVFWSQESSRSLFVRKDIGPGQGATVQIDASQNGEDSSGHGEFKTASSDGSKVFFTDQRRLSPGSTAGHSSAHEDLYLFDVNTGHLADLTIDGTDPGGASVLGVLEASEDGSYIYFVAKGSLPGTEAIAGADNLYAWHEGTTRFIGALSVNDTGHAGFHEPVVAHDWALSTGERTARTEAGGRRLVFMSDAPLTSYNNHNTHTGTAYEEVYLYDAVSNSLTCVSCNPSGTRPIGPSGIPGGTPWRAVGELGTYQSRVLSDDGSRVFFDSMDALVPQDTNGAQDVYEWEQDGSGTCRHSGGCVALLSGAFSTSDSSFVDASASGDDVFFITRSQLVSDDTDQLRDLYDARIGRGFPSTALSVPPCEGESCLPLVSPTPVLGSLASTTFSGIGNLSSPSSRPAAQVKVKKRSKPKKRRKHSGKIGRKANVQMPRGLHRRASHG